ncbi:hypothetical protein VF14_03080 [Nostoc linckia z18]|uniref:Uncharacterized protein n=2 Tax=Nostoc linckia TaxID=92942 RepID=A0A9Q5ZH88_NOSLI|nr:hypothetical protein [Nostoc linckia]PHK42365.1 hypothetical protein VF12_03095 [Nostoc linckia z15]PHK46806.1 hypothetical protein VF13_08965 [Nostoc linckia z16]PHJ69135.1 hypothetical protein VF02_00550 [Nostoc linckia z1]PHJ73286.1 hypothetical protein VF05_01565 [Nostoc linckia z3]PHJ78633.1 hypothetical protein VF03_00550 [Nostoc linckia z2]
MAIFIHKKFIQITLFTFLILLSVATTVKSQENSYVQFEKVEVATTPHKQTLYRLDYIYRIEGRDTVYIKQIGTVPAKGHLIYFAEKPEVEFRDPVNNSIIKIVEYKVFKANEDSQVADSSHNGVTATPTRIPGATSESTTPDSTITPDGITPESPGTVNSIVEWDTRMLTSNSIVQASGRLNFLGGVDIPKESEFQETARSESWVSPPTFQEIALGVFNKKFPLGIKPFQRDNLFFFLTPYIELSGLPNNLRGQVALLISQPYDSKGNKFIFRVQSLIREKRRREAIWSQTNISEETKRSASNLIDQILNEFKKI